ncbi:hypothetical protein R5R35_000270 [Gryllus longicercus]|uniref:Nucleoside diphosphate kinase homolog 5 n=1 Tax=Gryllus longicercus TaxID=2509291 RepID=A0AAN9Z3D3_9ORTH
MDQPNMPDYVKSLDRSRHHAGHTEECGPCECAKALEDLVDDHGRQDMEEKTLALIKPEGVPHLKEILQTIKDEGFDIIQRRKVFLTPEQASELYKDHYGQAYFPLLISHISSGPIYALCLSKPNAVKEWKRIIGPRSVKEAIREYPDTLRGRFGDPSEDMLNAVHGSDSRAEAEKEIHFFFPEMILEPLLTGDKCTDYLADNVNPTLLEGLSELCKQKPVDPIVWLADWLLTNNPNKPKTNEVITRVPT